MSYIWCPGVLFAGKQTLLTWMPYRAGIKCGLRLGLRFQICVHEIEQIVYILDIVCLYDDPVNPLVVTRLYERLHPKRSTSYPQS